MADLLLMRLAPVSPDRRHWHLPVAGAIIAATVWTGQLAGIGLAAGLGWPVELWSGVVLVAAAVAGLLGALAMPAAPARAGAEPEMHHRAS